MLEVKNLVKIYKAKGGVTVRALDDVSIKFKETGMIFLLGKSGSGKSTLLNVIGGLDKPDSGEIIIKGKNSKTFSGGDFDSYRNTYIGFIFQEYNILEEFNLEQNISLALQLQGKPNDKKAVEAILEQVDLAGLGKRKPNTLSGGQKQRVAIARALIKNPEIIMADEPTGALDSKTGKQVFDTLKKLSKEKLVIVVSHDRDFAEKYGDRIIELSDGKIISDVSKEYIAPKSVNSNIDVINENTISIKDTSKLTSQDVKELINILQSQKGEAIITASEKDLPVIKQTMHISEEGVSEVFKETEEVEVKEYDGKKTKFIRSHLPFSRAFKMGSSSLKSKPVRLIFTAILNIVALIMFGLTSTLMLFQENYTVSQALAKSERNVEAIRKEFKFKNTTYRINNMTDEKKESYSYESYDGTYFGESEVSNYNKSGLNFTGLITFTLPQSYSDNYIAYSLFEATKSPTYYYRVHTGFSGFVDKDPSELGFYYVGGHSPTSIEEIVLPRYLADGMLESWGVSTYADLIDKQLSVSIYTEQSLRLNFTISGVVNVGEEPTKYNDLKKDDGSLSGEQISKLSDGLKNVIHNSFHTVGFIHPSLFNEYKDYMQLTALNRTNNNLNMHVRGLNVDTIQTEERYPDTDSSRTFIVDEKILGTKGVKFYNTQGQEISSPSSLEEKEILLPFNEYRNWSRREEDVYYHKISSMFNGSGRRFSPSLNNLNENDPETYEKYENACKNLADNVYNDEYRNSEDYNNDLAILNQVVELYYKEADRNEHYYNEFDFLNYLGQNWNYTDDYNLFRQYYYEISDSFPYDFSKLDQMISIISNDINGNYYKIYKIHRLDEKSYYIDQAERERYIMFIDKFINTGNLEEDEWSLVNQMLTRLGFNEDDYHIDANYQSETLDLTYSTKFKYLSYKHTSGELTVKGFYSAPNYYEKVLTKTLIKNQGIMDEYVTETVISSSYVEPSDMKYSYLISNTTYSQSQIDVMLSGNSTSRVRMTNNTYKSLSYLLNTISTLKTTFLIIGIVFAVFAALMLFNFISTSIAAKTREIGILRAVGARGSDLFKIFFSESGLISLICVVISIVATIFIARYMNDSMSKDLGIQLLDFNLINMGIMIAGSMLIAFLGTFFPVLIASKKPPVESIRTL